MFPQVILVSEVVKLDSNMDNIEELKVHLKMVF